MITLSQLVTALVMAAKLGGTVLQVDSCVYVDHEFNVLICLP